jgi:hypothetical protein
MTLSDPEPKPDAAPRSAPKRRTRTRSRPAKPSMEPRVRVLLSMAGTAWVAVDDVCGGAFMAQVPDLAEAIGLWAKQDAKLYRWLDGMTSASGPLAVAVAAMPVAQAVAMHHILPAIERRRAAVTYTAEDFDAEIAAGIDDEELATTTGYRNPAEVVE